VKICQFESSSQVTSPRFRLLWKETYSVTTLEVLNVLPDLLDGIDRVDGRNGTGRICESLVQSLDLVEIDLESGCDDEEVVPDEEDESSG
jgi:hypothetical protein